MNRGEPSARIDEQAADLAAISAVLRGDRSAFRGIVERYKGLVYRLSLSYLHGPEEAQEASQEIFVKAFRALPSFRIERRFLPWLYAIASNHLRRRYGKLRRQETRETGGETDALPAPRSLDPQEALLRAESEQQVHEAIESLPRPVKEAVVLYYFEGMSVEQVSVALGIGSENVKSRLLRARRKMKDVLRAYATGEEDSGYSPEDERGEEGP